MSVARIIVTFIGRKGSPRDDRGLFLTERCKDGQVIDYSRLPVCAPTDALLLLQNSHHGGVMYGNRQLRNKQTNKQTNKEQTGV